MVTVAVHFQHECLSLAQGRLFSRKYSINANDAGNTRADVGDRGEDDEEIGNGSEPLEEPVGDENEGDSDQ